MCPLAELISVNTSFFRENQYFFKRDEPVKFNGVSNIVLKAL